MIWFFCFLNQHQFAEHRRLACLSLADDLGLRLEQAYDLAGQLSQAVEHARLCLPNHLTDTPGHFLERRCQRLQPLLSRPPHLLYFANDSFGVIQDLSGQAKQPAVMLLAPLLSLRSFVPRRQCNRECLLSRCACGSALCASILPPSPPPSSSSASARARHPPEGWSRSDSGCWSRLPLYPPASSRPSPRPSRGPVPPPPAQVGDDLTPDRLADARQSFGVPHLIHADARRSRDKQDSPVLRAPARRSSSCARA